jgi:hypothetical protein
MSQMKPSSGCSRWNAFVFLSCLPALIAPSTTDLQAELSLNDAVVEKSDKQLVRGTPGRRPLRGLQEQGGADRKYVYDEIYENPNIPIVQFPLANQRLQRKSGNVEEDTTSQEVPENAKEALIEEPTCLPLNLDFQKAADGRFLRGGTFVENEWSSVFGIKVKASNHEGKKTLHPMIFDSLNVESNGLETNDAFFLGSPNFECGGFGVGQGGRMGNSGENCRALGNLLIPSRKVSTNKKQKDPTPFNWSQGGILTFEFKEYTEVKNIGLLNAGDNSTIEVRYDEGQSQIFGVQSVGANGFQKIDVGVSNVESLAVSLISLSGIASLGLCVQFELPTADSETEGNDKDNEGGRN